MNILYLFVKPHNKHLLGTRVERIDSRVVLYWMYSIPVLSVKSEGLQQTRNSDVIRHMCSVGYQWIKKALGTLHVRPPLPISNNGRDNDGYLVERGGNNAAGSRSGCLECNRTSNLEPPSSPSPSHFIKVFFVVQGHIFSTLRLPIPFPCVGQCIVISFQGF